MTALLVGRLVSGLGVSTKTAALSFTRQATCDVPAPTSLLCLASSAWRHWPDPNYGLGCGAFSCATTTSSRPSSPFISSTAAAANEPATARASGCHSQSFATIASTATNSTENAASTSGFTRVSSAASAAAAPGPSVGSSTPDGNFTPVTAETGASAGARANDDNSWGPLGEPKPDLVEKFLSLDVCSSGEQRRAERQKVLRDFQRHPADTGSPPVMVALWTHRVRSLVRVFDSGRKQLPSIRQLEMLANKRRRMLTWLRRTDFKSYSYTITKLGLRDIYVPAGGANRYREGTRSCDPVDDQINRLRFNFHTKYRQGKTSMWYRLRPKLVAEDPALQSADAAAAVEDRQRRQQRREVAAQQRMAAEREQRK
ncbi:hypothetical protein Vretimale_13615 [Volvox reticuliferus]|uniref:Small ribosomal subunit protein uS15c n=1 Tax=Volvox reticuliferus TaxID=1737510 RepID=A0A8J4GMA8_9CHLO|nr:hypothetical protein Vretifemale_446 [Volvox reticuliferus]GIM09801.1 hypothetical protein Vretimale_13615 [Volvox reticuliferus]